MGVSGTIEHLSDLVSSTGGHKLKKKKKKQAQIVKLKIKMDCDSCELKVKNASSPQAVNRGTSKVRELTMCSVFILCFILYEGVDKVEIHWKPSMVTVTGYVDQANVLKKVKSTGKKVEIWPYVPYNIVSQPYAPQTYDKRAPAGHDWNVEFSANIVNMTPIEDPYTTMFSDDNPNACSIR